ncbi:MAG: T9SS type A sorting domain-containing protein [Flavobacteriales bacterium]|nr:T9SS type A sorting domain-containing protein [Flavobacteriales bacterium]
MRRLLLPLIPLCAAQLSAQTTYDHTIPTEYTGVNSYVNFTFPATPPTTGGGTLRLQWAACYSGGFGPSEITLQINTSQGWVTILDEDDNTSSCTFVNEFVNIPAGQLADAIATGGGSVQGRVDVEDGCQPGVGCSFLNDPVVRQLRLSYEVGSADFSNSDASICPGGTVAFTDASINNPSAFEWIFEGGQPATSTLQDPVVQYAAPGSYMVTLIVQTADGPDTLEVPGAVVVQQLPVANAGADENSCEGEAVQLLATGGVTYQWIPATGLSDATVANPTTTPTGNVTYTVLVTDAEGCQGNDAVTITVHPAPVLTVDAGNNVLCTGDTLDMLAEGASLYTWSPNIFLNTNSGAAVQAWPAGDFTWTVTGTDGFGCEASTSVSVTVVPAATTPVITSDGAALVATAATAYQWLLAGEPVAGATEADYTPTANGDYSVVITDANGCQAESATVYYGSVGLHAMDAASLRVFPQPADERLVVSGTTAGAQVLVLDAAGRTVRTQRATADGQAVLNVATLTAGHYIVEVRDGDAVQRVPVVVE